MTSKSVSQSRAVSIKENGELAALDAKITRLRKQAASQKKRINRQDTAITDLNSTLKEQDDLIKALNITLSKVTGQRDRVLLLYKEAQERNDAMIAEMSGEDDRGGRRGEQRSFAVDSVAIVQEQSRTPVETTLNNVRAKLRTPSKPRR